MFLEVVDGEGEEDEKCEDEVESERDVVVER